MKNKDKRHKIEEREELTNSQRDAIAAKSNNKCVWCGKKVYYGYGGTVDHFVPLKKGGTNNFDNLVLMCHDCNQKKGSKIVPIGLSAIHLKESEKKKLENYFENYIETYDYISRGNLMACDIYQIYIVPEVMYDMYARSVKKGKKNNIKFKQSSYLLKRAYPDDESKLVDYFIRYLKKYNELDSEESAESNIKFWMRFGSIYYIDKKDEMSVMSTVTVNRNGYVSINVFPFYSTMLSYSMAKGIVTCIGDAITKENNLPYLPVCVNMIKSDSLTSKILNLSKSNVIDDRLACQVFFLYNEDHPGMKNDDFENDPTFKEGVKEFHNFISRFYDIEDKINYYLYENNMNEYSWMAEEITGRAFFDEKYYRPIED